MIETNKEIYLCAINNVESGTCNEDCKFCTQSVKYKANIQRYKRKSIENIIKEAKIAKQNKAIGYCLVTAGAELNDSRVEFISEAAYNIKKYIPNLWIIACNGIASLQQLKQLKQSGVDNYNHNLETSQKFYKEICTTHNWEDRFETCLNVKQSGLNLCSGGIFGMGESLEDRISMLNSIKELKPKSVPLNFFHPNKALPIVKNTLDIDDSFNIIKKAREILPNVMLMIAGGREITFKDKQYDIFKYGANSIVIGNYLTTQGNIASSDLDILENMGYTIATTCKG
jgi:biotin synthase